MPSSSLHRHLHLPPMQLSQRKFPQMEQIDKINGMSKVFKVTPKRTKRSNGTVLTPDMEVIVTTAMHCSNPFANGAKEIQEAYMRLYNFDYKKACCTQSDFIYSIMD